LSETVIITASKSVTRKRLVKTEDFGVCCGYSEIWRVWISETVAITVLKSVTRKSVVKTKNFGCGDVWCVWFSGTVIVSCGGDP
jgi:hypothetical protein